MTETEVFSALLDYCRLGPELNNGDAVFELCLTRNFANILATRGRKAPQIAPEGQHKREAASASPGTNSLDIL